MPHCGVLHHKTVDRSIRGIWWRPARNVLHLQLLHTDISNTINTRVTHFFKDV